MGATSRKNCSMQHPERQTSQLRAVALLAAAFLALALTPRSQAQTFIDAEARVGGYQILERDTYRNRGPGQQDTSLAADFSSPYPNAPGSGYANVTANVDWGVLRVGAAAECRGGCGAIGQAVASFADQMTISRPDLLGQIGVLTTRVDYFWIGEVQYTITAAGGTLQQSNGSTYVDFRLDGLGTVWAGDRFTTAQIGGAPFLRVSDLGGSLESLPFAFSALATTRFVFGNTLPFSMSLSVGAIADGLTYPIEGSPCCGQLSSFALLDAAHSAYWGGMTVALANGTVIDDYALTSASGTDWRRSFVPGAPVAPVPEPSTYALFLAGLGGVAFMARRRQRQEAAEGAAGLAT